ncbi:MAG: hypothetical protein L0Y67_06130 [Gammaproteobacteria bacterium]|nr:hypothetical protein [Gammaproteobacteria bacterium]MCI0591164.1 hypothetical protein [Gammaproteobacteria bacterium]
MLGEGISYLKATGSLENGAALGLHGCPQEWGANGSSDAQEDLQQDLKDEMWQVTAMRLRPQVGLQAEY